MKVQRPSGGGSPVSSVGRVSAAPTVKPAQPVDAAGGISAPKDVTTVIGIPEAEFTPKVRAAIERLMEEVQLVRQELDQAKKRVDYLEKLADQDVLTPVLNRRAFVRELGRMMAYSERYEVPGSVIYADVNGMKQINDNLGHQAGDEAIKQVASILLNNVRSSDIVGRLGGDEFGIILLQASPEVALEKAQLLAQKVASQPFDYEGQSVSVSISYGEHSFQGGDADEALKAADLAMYEQKKAKKLPE
ncbi:GGDEF domain-containing protein [Kiloniella laminariae]|uniref:GGDEF domain-containing protein n=1 Tax=Kiloniella laminariae TaxID=454162 RepID=UPI000375E34D|nr:GGDEF domain-containing protein [Kiloniella laminariae]